MTSRSDALPPVSIVTHAPRDSGKCSRMYLATASFSWSVVMAAPVLDNCTELH